MDRRKGRAYQDSMWDVVATISTRLVMHSERKQSARAGMTQSSRPRLWLPVLWRTLATLCVALTAAILSSASGLAQDAPGAAAAAASAPSGVDDEARSAFREGTEAAEKERWADSERAFRKAYGLSHAPSALFNQAVALRALGRHVEARNAFDSLLAGQGPELSPDLQKSTEELRAESASRVAVLNLTGLTLSPHRIRVDGKPVVDTLKRPLAIELDEGVHSVEIALAGHETWLTTQEILPSEQRSLAVVLKARREPEAPRKSHKKLVYWLSGAALLLAGGAVTTVIVLKQREADEPLAPRAATVYEVP